MFDLDTYHKKLNTRWLGQSVCYFDELESTSTYLKKLPHEEIAHGLICIADHQSKGRGQYERDWESEKGKSLTFTIAFLPTNSTRFHILTLACAKAGVDQFSAYTDKCVNIKWPNDILIDGKKVGGLLTETTFNGNRLERLLVGIGLNINQETFSDSISDKATSLRQVLGKTVQREQFLCEYLSRIEYEYGRWHKKNPDLLKEINQKIKGYGCWIRLLVDGEERKEKSKLLGINEEGELVVINDDGGIETYSYEQIRLITD